jgi:hypothetical protein
MRAISKALIATAALAGAISCGVSQAQTPTAAQGYKTVQGPHTLNPGDWPGHYPFADETEAAVAAPEVHHVRYIDSHVRLVEVGYFPGVQGNMHGHPFPSVFAIDSPVPKATNTPLDPARNMVSVLNAPLDGVNWPVCRAASPQLLHHETNQDTFPHHFYRLEFLRIDGDGLKDHWKAWYPWATSKLARDRVLYEDDHVRMVEVLVKSGEALKPVTDRYPSVFAFDGAGGLGPAGKGVRTSPPLEGFKALGCGTASKGAAGPVSNNGATPIHYYRIDFKRIDGDGIKDHWREWYPWMATLKDEYDRSPNIPNF